MMFTEMAGRILTAKTQWWPGLLCNPGLEEAILEQCVFLPLVDPVCKANQATQEGRKSLYREDGKVAKKIRDETLHLAFFAPLRESNLIGCHRRSDVVTKNG